MTKIKITVTRADIREGHSGSCWRCPIALAINRALKAKAISSLDAAQVMSTQFRLAGSSLWGTLGKSAREFIRRFDQGKSVKPFSFFLVIP